MKTIAIALSLFCIFSFAETSEESIYGTTTGNISLTSDYLARGLTQTNHGPALQGGIDWNHPTGLGLGVWGSNVYFPSSGTNQSLEMDLAANYTYEISRNLSVGIGATYYAYFRSSALNSYEFPLEISWELLRFMVSYSPRWGGANVQSLYFSVGASPSLFWGLRANLSTGYSFLSETSERRSYADFRAGLSRELLGLTWDVSAVFVDRRQSAEGEDDPRLVFTLAKSL